MRGVRNECSIGGMQSEQGTQSTCGSQAQESVYVGDQKTQDVGGGEMTIMAWPLVLGGLWLGALLLQLCYAIRHRPEAPQYRTWSI